MQKQLVSEVTVSTKTLITVTFWQEDPFLALYWKSQRGLFLQSMFTLNYYGKGNCSLAVVSAKRRQNK